MSLPEVSLGGPGEMVPPVRVRSADRSETHGGPGLRPAGLDSVRDAGPAAPDVTDRTGSRRSSDRRAVVSRTAGPVRYFAGQVADAVRRAGTVGSLGDGRPESWNQYRARVAARAWLPADYEGKALIVIPAIFYNTVGAAGWGLGAGTQWLATHMLAFCTAFLLVAAAVLLWLIFS